MDVFKSLMKYNTSGTERQNMKGRGISTSRPFNSFNIGPIITVSKSKHQLFLNFSFCTLPTPVLAILLRTLAPEGIGLHQLLSCHFHLPSKQALKMETLNKLTQSLHKPGEKQTHCFFLNTMTFRKSPGCFCFLGLIIEVRNTGTAAVSMTKLLSQINKQ